MMHAFVVKKWDHRGPIGEPRWGQDNVLVLGQAQECFTRRRVHFEWLELGVVHGVGADSG
jgi:hypothetical protein